MDIIIYLRKAYERLESLIAVCCHLIFLAQRGIGIILEYSPRARYHSVNIEVAHQRDGQVMISTKFKISSSFFFILDRCHTEPFELSCID